MLFVLVSSLVVYKSTGALRQIEYARANGAVALRADTVSAEAVAPSLRVGALSVNYFAVIWPALVFGVLIGAAVSALTPPAALSRLFGRGLFRPQLVAAVSGAPLMLCSCCAAPVFSSVYERCRQLAPSLALMLAAPSLNPAALALTFLLFPSSIAWGRLWMSVVAVFLGTALVARLAPEARIALRVPPVADDQPATLAIRAFLRACLRMSARTVPVIVLGILAAVLFADRVTVQPDISSSTRVWSIVVIAAIAVPIALPTFFEIPLAVTLLAAGAPPGAAAAVLFAGPAVNLASLLTVAHSAGWRVVSLVAAMVWLIAVIGGLALG